METELIDLEQRMARAERQVRVLRGMVLVVILTAAGFLFIRPGIAENEGSIFKAPLQVIDPKGKILMVVRSREGSGELEIRSRDGAPIAGFTSNGTAGVVFYRGSEGRTVQVGDPNVPADK